jgi:hypothetical protein
MVQRANPGIFVPAYNTLKYHIKCLAEVCRQFPERQKKSYGVFMIAGSNKFRRLFWWWLYSWRIRLIPGLEGFDDERALAISSTPVMVVSVVAARNYVVTACCTDNPSNEVSTPNELNSFHCHVKQDCP